MCLWRGGRKIKEVSGWGDVKGRERKEQQSAMSAKQNACSLEQSHTWSSQPYSDKEEFHSLMTLEDPFCCVSRTWMIWHELHCSCSARQIIYGNTCGARTKQQWKWHQTFHKQLLLERILCYIKPRDEGRLKKTKHQTKPLETSKSKVKILL